MKYRPDSWIIVKVRVKSTDEIMYRVLGGWSGGYLDGDSWRLGSPIQSFKRYMEGDDEYIEFSNESGSKYVVLSSANRVSLIIGSTLEYLENNFNKDGTDLEISHIDFEEVKFLEEEN